MPLNDKNFFALWDIKALPDLDIWLQQRKYNAIRQSKDKNEKSIIGLSYLTDNELIRAGVIWVNKDGDIPIVLEMVEGRKA